MIRDRGVDSVRANHVANVPFPGENTTTKFMEFVRVVREEFEEMHGKHRYTELSEEDVVKIPEIKERVNQLTVSRFDYVSKEQSWDWKFGQTPEFTERLILDKNVRFSLEIG